MCSFFGEPQKEMKTKSGSWYTLCSARFANNQMGVIVCCPGELLVVHCTQISITFHIFIWKTFVVHVRQKKSATVNWCQDEHILLLLYKLLRGNWTVFWTVHGPSFTYNSENCVSWQVFQTMELAGLSDNARHVTMDEIFRIIHVTLKYFFQIRNNTPPPPPFPIKERKKKTTFITTKKLLFKNLQHKNLLISYKVWLAESLLTCQKHKQNDPKGRGAAWWVMWTNN